MGLVESRDRLNEALAGSKLELKLIDEWFRELKSWEAEETWERAFDDGRIAMRIVNPNSNTTPPKIDKVTGTLGNLTVTQSKAQPAMFLDRSASGIMSRMNADNFSLNGRASQKTALGLHDLPGTLLNPAKLISDQAKGYFSPTTAVFMPVPKEKDLTLFYVLSDMAKGERKTESAFVIKIQDIRNRLTRIKLAQSTDMGTGWVNLKKPNDDRDHYRYGLYGTITDPTPEGEEKKKARPATSEELKDRLVNRVKYQTILSGSDGHNEIVVAFRSHANTAVFPMFTQYQSKKPTPKDEKYLVISSTGAGKGMFLTDAGKLIPA